MDDTDSAPAPDDLLLFTPVATAYRGANGWTRYDDRMTLAALRSCSRRQPLFGVNGEHATKLLADAMELLHGREMREASEDKG